MTGTGEVTAWRPSRLSRRLSMLMSLNGPVADAVHLFVLSSIVIAQPLWSLVGNSGEFFLARDADAAEVVLTALAVLICPAALMLGIQWSVAVVSLRARRIVHLVEMSGLALLMFLRVASQLLDRPAWVVVSAASVAAALAIAAMLLTSAARFTLTALTPLPVILLVLFIFTSEASVVMRSWQPEALERPVSLTRKAPVVFLIFDELQGTSIMNEALEIDEARVPNLARFAKQATWFRDAITVHEYTYMAVPAILTGNRTNMEALPVSGQYPVNLFTLLGAGGYKIRADELLTRLCPRAHCPEEAPKPALLPRVGRELADLSVVYAHATVPREMTKHLPQLNLAWGNFLVRPSDVRSSRSVGLRNVVDQDSLDRASGIDRFIRKLRPSAAPTLDYLHTSISHAPYDRLPNGKSYAPTDMTGVEPTHVWSPDDFLATQGQQRNLLQLGYVDYQLGRILDRLKTIERFDESMIILTADHGSANVPRLGRRKFEKETLGEIVSVPLFIKLPGQQQGQAIERSAETTDILPTIADALGMQISGSIDGHSLLNPGRTLRPRIVADASGQKFQIPPDFPQRRAAVGRNYERFGRNGDSFNLYAVGPYRSLVGSHVSSFPISNEQPLTAALDDAGSLQSPPPEGVSRSRIMGRLSGLPAGVPAGSPVHLAIGVDGKIIATSRSYRVRGQNSSLSIFVPDDSFSSSEHLEIFAVTGPVTKPQLSRVSRS